MLKWPPRLFPFARFAVAVVAAAAAPVACSSSSEPAPTATLALALSVNVAAGSETHRCRFVKVDSAFNGYITSMRHEYTPGSHHLVLFRTDLSEIAPGSEGDLDCYARGRDVMAHARGVLYASQTASGSATLPEGVGLPIAAGEVLLLQAHYLNPGTAPLEAKVDLRMAVVRPRLRCARRQAFSSSMIRSSSCRPAVAPAPSCDARSQKRSRCSAASRTCTSAASDSRRS